MDKVEHPKSMRVDKVRFEQLRAINRLINSASSIRMVFMDAKRIEAHLRPEIEMYLGTKTAQEVDYYQYTFVKYLKEYLNSGLQFKRAEQINEFAKNIKVGDGVLWFIRLLQSLWHLKNDSGEVYQIPKREQAVAILVPVYNEIKFTELCFRSIRKLAGFPHYVIAVNNSTKDIGSFREAVLEEGLVDDWFDTGCTKHGDGLQKALGLVRRFNYIATMDSDAIGLKKDWLREFVEELNSKNAGLIGPVRRPGLRDIISFAIHPCCMVINQERLASKFQIDFRSEWPYWDSGGLLTWDCLLNDIPIVKASQERNSSCVLHSTLVNKSVKHYWYASRILDLDDDTELDGHKVEDIRQRLARDYQSLELEEIKKYRVQQKDIVKAGDIHFTIKSKKQIHLLMITYNRLGYTRCSLRRLLADPAEEFALTLWDNGSTDGTKDYLKTVTDPRIADMVFSDENKGQTYVTNKIWSETSAELVGKVDNDCLVTPGWTQILARAHADLPKLGVVGCWHFPPEDFDYERAKHKIQTFNRHQIFRHPWVDGSALMVKRSTYMDHAPCTEDEYLSGFWIKLATAGYINGFYFPLIYQEHMDDPKSKYCMFKDQDSYNEAKKVSYCIRWHRLDTLNDFMRWQQKVLDNLLDDPWQVKYYVGWRGKIRRLKERFSELFGNNH